MLPRIQPTRFLRFLVWAGGAIGGEDAEADAAEGDYEFVAADGEGGEEIDIDAI
jgi:hypothetical protein